MLSGSSCNKFFEISSLRSLLRPLKLVCDTVEIWFSLSSRILSSTRFRKALSGTAVIWFPSSSSSCSLESSKRQVHQAQVLVVWGALKDKYIKLKFLYFGEL
mgnify:CR=1 FL=1